MPGLASIWISRKLERTFKRRRWTVGAVYGIPLKDGSFGICQAVDQMLTTVIYVAIFSYRFSELPKVPPHLSAEDIVSLHATWRSDLNSGRVAFVGTAPLVVTKSAFPNEAFAESGYVGATHADIEMFSDFLDAYFGITPWNVMYDEDCWETYLNAGNPRPEGVRILSADERQKYRTEVKGISTNESTQQ